MTVYNYAVLNKLIATYENSFADYESAHSGFEKIPCTLVDTPAYARHRSTSTLYYNENGDLDFEYSLFRYAYASHAKWKDRTVQNKVALTAHVYFIHLFLLGLKKRNIAVEVFHGKVESMSEGFVPMDGYDEYLRELPKYYAAVDSFFNVDEYGKDMQRRMLRYFGYELDYTVGENNPTLATTQFGNVRPQVAANIANWSKETYLNAISINFSPIDLYTFMDTKQIVMATLLLSDSVIVSSRYGDGWSVMCSLDEEVARHVASKFPDHAEALVGHSLGEIQCVLKMQMTRAADDEEKEFYSTLRARVMVALSEPDGIFGDVLSSDLEPDILHKLIVGCHIAYNTVLPSYFKDDNVVNNCISSCKCYTHTYVQPENTDMIGYLDGIFKSMQRDAPDSDIYDEVTDHSPNFSTNPEYKHNRDSDV